MNTFQLWYALTSNPITASKFDGVFSSDTLPDVGSVQPELLICNTDPSHRPGKHWIAFFRQHDTLEFFDSLGKDIAEYGEDFTNFVSNVNAYNVKKVPTRIQPEGTSLCGQYCLYYAYARMRGQDINDIVQYAPCTQTLCNFVKDIYCIYPEGSGCSQLCNQGCIIY